MSTKTKVVMVCDFCTGEIVSEHTPDDWLSVSYLPHPSCLRYRHLCSNCINNVWEAMAQRKKSREGENSI